MERRTKMNSYKELIYDLRRYFYDTGVVLEAANAIEQLVKERDAAVSDLTIDKNCDFCKWSINGDCTDLEHDECHGEHWEWCGIKEDNDE